MKGPEEPIVVATNFPVTAPALEKALELIGASSKEDLIAWRSKPVRFRVEAVPANDASERDTRWLVVPAEPFAIGHWYRFRVAPSLQGAAPLPLGVEIVSWLRGPEPLQVTDVACGYPVCTPENHWTISFNAELDEASLGGCFSTRPALELGAPRLEGWSVVVEPKGAKVGTEYHLIVNKSCKNSYGDRLRTPYEARLRIEAPRARLSMAAGTGYMTPAKAGTSPVVNVGAGYTGRLTVGTTRLDKRTLPAFLAANLESWGGLSFAQVEPERTTTLKPEGADAGDVNVPIPLANALSDGRGLVYVRVEAERKSDDDQPPMRQALVQVTELGLSVKSGPESTLVWVTSLVDQTPQAGVEIQALDPQGKTLWTRTTDAQGLAEGPGRKTDGDEDGAGQLRVVMASRGADLAFIDLAEYLNRSEPYDFAMPYAWDARAEALRGIVFTERGVYRSGETVHIKGYLRVERRGRLEKVPATRVAVTIMNPHGDRALERDVELGAVGDFELDLPLAESASLGTWRVETEITELAADSQAAPPVPTTDTPRRARGAAGAVAGSFRVEAYRPNTFEVKVGELMRRGDHLVASANGRYYYGAPMADAPARWWVNREDADFAPAHYEDFSFEVPSWSDRYWEPEGTSVENVASGEGKLDADGALAVDAAFAPIAGALASGPQNLILEVEVSDADQQVVTGRGSLRIESADHYLGVRPSTTFAGIGEVVQVDAIALTPEAKPVVGATIELRWLRREWVSKRVVSAGGGVSWESEEREIELEKRTLTSALEPVRASVSAHRSGLHWIELSGRDAKGRTMKSREAVWVWGDGASWSENDEGHVELIAAQETWKVGDTARFIVKSPFATARALVTVEAAGVMWHDARVLTGTAPLIEIPVSDAMQPNAYVSVVLLGKREQAPPGAAAERKAQADVPAEVRLGYARMSVDTNDRRVSVSVTPDRPSHQPGERVRATIALTDHQGQPVAGQVAFMAVDEGVLALTGYRTPDPHKAFFAERGLAVMSSEARRQLWSGLALDDGMKSDWGGGGGEGGEATNYRAAFATTAAFIPDVVVGASGVADVTFDLPDNLGAFRLMAVAATNDARFGRGESRLEVKKPLLVRAGLPRFLSVGDRFDARALVQTLDPEISGVIGVTVAVSGPVALEGKDRQDIAASTKATPISFSARATAPGTATFAFEVKTAAGDGGPRDAVEVSIPVLWPAAKRSAFSEGVLPASEATTGTTLRIPDWVRDDVGGIDVTLTSTRLGDLLPGLDYLLKYPYGCVEQTTGATLPLLAMSDLQSGFSLPGISKEAVLVRAQAGLDRLRSMQTWSGGIGYWPGETTPHPWGSVYAGMALVRASKMPGLEVQASVLERLTNYLRDILRDQAASARDEWHSELDVVKPFAAYVLALAGKAEPAFHATLFERRATLPDFGKLLLALAISESKGDAVMANTLLDEVVATVRVDGDRAALERADERYYYSTMDSDVRSMALLALALQAIRPQEVLLEKVQKGLLDARENGHWMSTQENAFAVLALARTFLHSERADAAFSAKVEVDGQVWLTEAMHGADATPRTVHLPMHLAKQANGKKLVIRRDGDEAPVYFSMRFDYVPKEIPTRRVSRGFSLDRRYTIANGPRVGQPADKVQAGDIVRVDITVATAEARRYVAVEDPLPAGLEPITLDFDTTRSALSALAADDGVWRARVFNHTEQRDDRVVLFSDAMQSGTHTHTYLARATTAGTFLAPSAHVHEMYHPTVSGQSQANELVVQ